VWLFLTCLDAVVSIGGINRHLALAAATDKSPVALWLLGSEADS
jgi:hypothetical protein